MIFDILYIKYTNKIIVKIGKRFSRSSNVDVPQNKQKTCLICMDKNSEVEQMCR